MTTYSLLQYGGLSDDYRKKTSSYYKHYVKIEFNPKIEHDTKLKHMEDWWRSSNQALVEEKATLASIYESVRSSNIEFREHSTFFFEQCEKYNIPILVFSAGITQVIEELFRSKSTLRDNIHIISNDLIVNEEDIIIGMSDPVIHSMNKGERSKDLLKAKESAFYRKNCKRKCVLLLGDAIGDTHMSDGFDTADIVLKVGFLNYDEDELYEEYKKVFDVVILNDGSMEFIIDILQEIIEKQ